CRVQNVGVWRHSTGDKRGYGENAGPASRFPSLTRCGNAITLASARSSTQLENQIAPALLAVPMQPTLETIPRAQTSPHHRWRNYCTRSAKGKGVALCLRLPFGLVD